MNGLPTGYLGVELFFVISGLIISYPFISAHFGGQQYPSLRNFYLRRITRLEPPYFLVMFGSYLFVRLTGYASEAAHTFSNPSAGLESSLAASLIYLHWLLVGGMPKLNPPAWSLEVEIEFYILAPIFLIAVFRLRRLVLIVLAILILSAGSIFVLHFPDGRSISLRTLPLTNFFHLFLTGIFVNVLTFGGVVPERLPAAIWDAGFAIAIAILYLMDSHEGSMLVAAAQVPCYTVLFLAAFNGRFFKRFLSLPWVFTVGGMCYTIYLIHLPMLQLLTGIAVRITGVDSLLLGLLVSAVLSLPILFAVSVAFFLLIEKPCMNPKWPYQVGNWVVGWATQIRSIGNATVAVGSRLKDRCRRVTEEVD